jgi:hypothetical protein
MVASPFARDTVQARRDGPELFGDAIDTVDGDPIDGQRAPVADEQPAGVQFVRFPGVVDDAAGLRRHPGQILTASMPLAGGILIGNCGAQPVGRVAEQPCHGGA